jgi:hypothetical protein
MDGVLANPGFCKPFDEFPLSCNLCILPLHWLLG